MSTIETAVKGSQAASLWRSDLRRALLWRKNFFASNTPEDWASGDGGVAVIIAAVVKFWASDVKPISARKAVKRR